MKTLITPKLVLMATLTLVILGQWLSKQLAYHQLYLLIWGAWLASHDLKNQAYPLWIWLLGTGLLLPFFPVTLTSLILFLIALLAEIIDLKIGSGDFFYLSTLALTLPLSRILWIIQLGALLAIATIYWQKKQQEAIAFVPFLLLAYALVLGINNLLP